VLFKSDPGSELQKYRHIGVRGIILKNEVGTDIEIPLEILKAAFTCDYSSPFITRPKPCTGCSLEGAICPIRRYVRGEHTCRHFVPQPPESWKNFQQTRENTGPEKIGSQLIPKNERISGIHLIKSLCDIGEECTAWFTLPEWCKQEYILCNGATIGFRFTFDDHTSIYVYGKTGYYGEKSGCVNVNMPMLGGIQSYTIGKIDTITRHKSIPTIAGINLKEF